jgi:hypothetical protein
MFFFRRLYLTTHPLIHPPRVRDYTRDIIIILVLGSYFRARYGLESKEGTKQGVLRAGPKGSNTRKGTKPRDYYNKVK